MYFHKYKIVANVDAKIPGAGVGRHDRKLAM